MPEQSTAGYVVSWHCLRNPWSMFIVHDNTTILDRVVVLLCGCCCFCRLFVVDYQMLWEPVVCLYSEVID